MLFALIQRKVARKDFDREDLMKKLDIFLLGNRLTVEEYESLVKLMAEA